MNWPFILAMLGHFYPWASPDAVRTLTVKQVASYLQMLPYVSEWSEQFGEQEMILTTFEQLQRKAERLGLAPPERYWRDLPQSERVPLFEALKEHQRATEHR